jgi:hypothetical protein
VKLSSRYSREALTILRSSRPFNATKFQAPCTSKRLLSLKSTQFCEESGEFTTPAEYRVLSLSLFATVYPFLRWALVKRKMCWSRIRKGGKYSGCLALTTAIDPVAATAKVLVIPRPGSDLNRKRKRVAATFGSGKRLEELEFSLGDLSGTGDSMTQAELDLIEQSGNQIAMMAIGAHLTPLRPGDRIQVMHGSVAGIQGTIVDIASDNTVTFNPRDPKEPNDLQVRASDVIRMFYLGEYVCIVRGRKKGGQGFIIELDDETATVFNPRDLDHGVSIYSP